MSVTRRVAAWAAAAIVVGCCVGLAVFLAHTSNYSFISRAKPDSHRYYVSPSGVDSATGRSVAAPFKTIQHALALARSGDHIVLADGDYYQGLKSVRSGTKQAPIVVEGSQKATVYGDSSRVVEIRHSYLTLRGFHINGQFRPGATKQDFRDKLIYVIGAKPQQGVRGLTITKMLIENAGGECVRLRYFAKHNEISHSTIRNCGIYDFRFQDGGKNGEGIYIGTAPEQRADGKNPTKDVDTSSDNYIHHNIIATHGNECVDIKEGSSGNIVEHNDCSYQMDPESGGFDARGAHNIFRYNDVHDTVGAGVRLGGDGKQDGVSNEVYGNTFTQITGGLLKILRLPQGKICNNTNIGHNDLTTSGEGVDSTLSCET
jgi:hypothetical protein